MLLLLNDMNNMFYTICNSHIQYSNIDFWHDSKAFWSFFCYIWLGFLGTQVSSGNCKTGVVKKPWSHVRILIHVTVYETWAMPPSALCAIIQKKKCVYSTRMTMTKVSRTSSLSCGAEAVVWLFLFTFIFLYFSHSKLMPGLTCFILF